MPKVSKKIANFAVRKIKPFFEENDGQIIIIKIKKTLIPQNNFNFYC